MLTSKGCYILHKVLWSLMDLFVIVGVDLWSTVLQSTLQEHTYTSLMQQMKSCDRGLRLLHCFNCIILKWGRGGYKVTEKKLSPLDLHEVQQTADRAGNELFRTRSETYRSWNKPYRARSVTCLEGIKSYLSSSVPYHSRDEPLLIRSVPCKLCNTLYHRLIIAPLWLAESALRINSFQTLQLKVIKIVWKHWWNCFT